MEKETKEATSAVANDGQTVAGAAKCPVAHGARGRRNREWWPDALDISVLHRNSSLSDPRGEGFDYAKEFETLDLHAVIKDLHALMTLPGLVACRFRPLWRVDDPHGLAQRRDLSDYGRPRRRRSRAATLRATE